MPTSRSPAAPNPGPTSRTGPPKSETRKAFARLPEVAGRDLAPLAGWLRWTDSQRAQLVRLEQAATQELHKRREVLIEAQRKVRSLEKLHEHRKAEWQADFDRELEEQAADAFRSGLRH